jgi:hypothetical protein
MDTILSELFANLTGRFGTCKVYVPMIVCEGRQTANRKFAALLSVGKTYNACRRNEL